MLANMKFHRLILLAIAVCCLAAAVIWAARDYTSQPRLILGPMIHRMGPTGFTLSWQMHPLHPATVEIFDSSGTPAGSFEAQCETERCVAEITALTPATEYRYRIVATDGAENAVIVAEHSTRSAPAGEAPLRILAFGDSGTGGREQWRIARLMKPYRPDLVLHTGDLIYPGGRCEDHPYKFFRPYAELLASCPMYVALGNHEARLDASRPFLRTFMLPANGPPSEEPGRFYWLDHGGVRIVGIDSNHDHPFFQDVIAPWLKQVLASAGDRWKIIFWHEPVFTNSRYPPAEKLLVGLVPVIDRHRVHLVLHGHNHLYERTYPIREGQIVAPSEGTVYVTTGAGGANLYEAGFPRAPFLASTCDHRHSFTLIDVTAERLYIRQIPESNETLDEFQIPR